MAGIYVYDYTHIYGYDSAAGYNALWDRFPTDLRLYDPYAVTYYEQDFVGVTPASNTINGWTFTQATSGTVTEDATNPNGIALLSAGAVTAGQGVNWQMSGSPFKVAANKPVAFEVYGKFTGLSTTPKLQFFAGLAEQTTALITANAFAVKDRLGIGGVSTTGVLQSHARGGGTAVLGTGVTIADTVWHRLGFYAAAGQVDFYVDGVIVSSSTTQIPTGALAPIIVVQGNATVTPSFSCDYVRVAGYRQ